MEREKFSGHPDEWPDDEWNEYVAYRAERLVPPVPPEPELYTPSTEDIRFAWRAWSDGQVDTDEEKPTWSFEEFDRWFAEVQTDAYFLGAEALADQWAEDKFDGPTSPQFDSLYAEGVTYKDWLEKRYGTNN